MIVPTTMAKGTPQTADDLTHAEMELLSHCRRIQFGRIVNFLITDGQPQFGDDLSTERWIKFDERKLDSQPKPRGLTLKKKQSQLIKHIRSIESGYVVELLVRHGLPDTLKIQERA